MNTCKWLISSLMLVSVLFSACQAQATSVAPTVPSPTDVPPPQAPVGIESAVDLDQVADISTSAETVNVDFLNNRVPLPAFDSIWFLSDTEGKVTRWDPETRQVLATIQIGNPDRAPYGDPVSAVVTSDAIWITSVGTHEIVKVDPQTNQIVDRITLPKANGDQDFFTNNIVLVGNSAWVWDYDKKIAQGIDLRTKQVVGIFENVQSISSLDGSLWRSDTNGMMQIDLETEQAVKELPAGSPIPVVSAEGSMWGFNNAVYRMDSETYQVTAKIDLGIPVRDLKLVNGSLWVTVSAGAPPACLTGSYLIQIDPKTSMVIGKTALGCPLDITVYKDSLWVAGGTDDQLLLTHIQ